MGRTNKELERLFVKVETLLQNAVDDTIKAHFEEVGITPQKLTDVQLILSNTRALNQQQKVKYGELFAAQDAFDAKLKETKKTYMRHVKTARIAAKDDRATFQKLGVDGRRERQFSLWVEQAKQFYTTALNDVTMQAILANNALTVEKLEAGKQLVEASEAAFQVLLSRRGDSHLSTVFRNESWEGLENSYSDYRKLARVALADKPQLLEKLGIPK